MGIDRDPSARSHTQGDVTAERLDVVIMVRAVYVLPTVETENTCTSIGETEAPLKNQKQQQKEGQQSSNEK